METHCAFQSERPARCGAANNLHEITPSHCRLRSKTKLSGIQLPSSKQKIASSETGLNAQCALRNPEQRMSALGHSHRGEVTMVSNRLPLLHRSGHQA
jgi:hypothetical protein